MPLFTLPKKRQGSAKAWGLILVASLACASACSTSNDAAPVTTTRTISSTPASVSTPAPVSSTTEAAEITEVSQPSSSSIDDAVQQAVDEVSATMGATVGLAIKTTDGIAHAGVDEDAAWSTIKVPIAIAALRQNPDVMPAVHAAITISDNASAQALFDGLAQPAADTQAVLAETGDNTVVNDVVTRPGFTSFGQTRWSLSNQVVFAHSLSCVPQAGNVIASMRAIDPSQSYGLGTIPGSAFKGGWGPNEQGMYVVRQFGLITVDGKQVAVAISAQSHDGTYESAQLVLNELAAKAATIAGLETAQAACV